MQALAVQRLRRLTLPLLVMSAWALRQLMQNQVERHRYRLWPRLRQLLVPIGPEMSPSRAALVPRYQLGLVQVAPQLAGQSLHRLPFPMQVMAVRLPLLRLLHHPWSLMAARALRRLMQIQV